MEGDRVIPNVGFDVGPRPARQRLYLQLFAFQELEGLGPLAGLGLITPHPRDPALVPFEQLALGLDLVQVAAAIAIPFVERSVLGPERLAAQLRAQEDVSDSQAALRP